MGTTSNRREFLQNGSMAAAGILGSTATGSSQERPTGDHEHATHEPTGPVNAAADRGKLTPGRQPLSAPPVSIVVPDLTKMPWKMRDGAKEFHLHCRPTRREFLPGMAFDVWGFNGSMPGPTIEVVEGDKVRLIVHNELPESTVIHWHGLEVPNRLDGVPGLTQDPIKPGASSVYEFELHQNGTFFYHSHGPMQEGMGMAGLFIIHPRRAHQPAVDHDFALMLQEWAILPQSTIPNTMSMEFNFFTINGRSGPYVTPLVVRQGSRVRIRFVNMSAIDHHPMHLHGHTFWITGTEAGRIPETAWLPSNNVLVAVGQARDVEFIANNPGDWMIHCHMFHHMMNHMSSMVGPMAGHPGQGMTAGRDMANSMGMLSLGRGESMTEELGPSLGRGLGEQNNSDIARRNGPGPERREKDPRYLVPGYPQDMMDMHGMHPPEYLRMINTPLTRGMRKDWYIGVEALMTVLRVLPDGLYEKVVSGKGDVAPGASVPGGGAGGGMPEHHH